MDHVMGFVTGGIPGQFYTVMLQNIQEGKNHNDDM